MRETFEGLDPSEGTDDLVRDSLAVLAGVYVRRSDGSFQFMGTRPVGGWHGHGWTRKFLVVLTGGKPAKVVLHKHRWLLPGTTTTCHSRPPDDPAFIRFCTLIVVLRVWSFINSAVGLCKQSDLEGSGSKRTMQRWTARAMGRALETQQAIRAAILELRRSEPRPEEDWFRGGLSPPSAVTGRRWQSPTLHQSLWRAFAMLFVGAKELGVTVATLLAEARRRWHAQDDSFPF
jgi:hypothetical protein